MNQMYDWVRAIFTPMWPEIERLTGAEPDAEATARRWFERLVRRFEERGIKIQSIKNHVVAVRNTIRELDPHHFSLPFVTFEPEQWVAINAAGEDRLEERLRHQKLLPDPDTIIRQAEELLAARLWPQVAVGLAVCVGRRISELLSADTVFAPCTAYSVTFRGQRKHRPDEPDFEYEIPTLAPAAAVLAAWERLRKVVGAQSLSPRKLNSKYGPLANEAADAAFADLVPVREGEDSRYMHLYRAVYATLAVRCYCPPEINAYVFKAEIQGHRKRLEGAGDPENRRSMASQLHYDDYKAATPDGLNIDGRQGLRLGLPGVEVLRVFQTALAGGRPVPALDLAPRLAAPADGEAEAPASEAPEVPLPAPTPPMETPAPVESPAPAAPELGMDLPPEAPRVRPVSHRVYPADFARLQARRRSPKESQADNLHRLLEEFSEALRDREELVRLRPELDAAHEALRPAQARAGELESALAERRAEIARLEEASQALRAEEARARRDVRTMAQALLAEAQDTGDEAHAARLTAIAGQMLNWPLLKTGTVQAAPEAPVPLVAAAPPDRSPPAAPAIPAAAPAAAAHPAASAPSVPKQSAQPAPAEAPAPAPTPSAADKPPRKAPGALRRAVGGRSEAARARIARAVQTVMAHNDRQEKADNRWAITPRSVGRLTGCYRGAIAAYFEAEANQTAIEAHNEKYGLTKYTANGQGRLGMKITDAIRFDNDGTPEEQETAD